jgi:hypothetical protein
MRKAIENDLYGSATVITRKEKSMKRLKTSTRFLIASLVVFTTFAAGLLIASQMVLAATNPVRGIGVVVKKNPGGSTARATTGDDGKFTVPNLEPGSYTVSLKHADKVAPDSFKTLVVTIEGARGTPIKWFPIAELQKGVTFEIEVAGKGPSTITGTCMATDKER